MDDDDTRDSVAWCVGAGLFAALGAVVALLVLVAAVASC